MHCAALQTSLFLEARGEGILPGRLRPDAFPVPQDGIEAVQADAHLDRGKGGGMLSGASPRKRGGMARGVSGEWRTNQFRVGRGEHGHEWAQRVALDELCDAGCVRSHCNVDEHPRGLALDFEGRASVCADTGAHPRTVRGAGTRVGRGGPGGVGG